MKYQDMKNISLEIAKWAEKNNADVIGILDIKTPTEFLPKEKIAIQSLLRQHPHIFSAAQKALSQESDDEWIRLLTYGVDGDTFSPLFFFTGNNPKKLNMAIKAGSHVKAWIVITERSNNYFGDTDSILVILSQDSKPIAYCIAGVNANSSDEMCGFGIYIPPDVLGRTKVVAKQLDEIHLK